MTYNGFNIENAKEFSTMKSIARDGSGKLPITLTGLYTTAGEAMRAIDSYVNTKGTKDGKQNLTS